MKDHVEIGHLTTYGALRVNRDQVMDLEIWFKFHTKVSNFETASPKIKTCPKVTRTLPISVSKISEDYRRLSRKTRRCFDHIPTNLSTI